MIDYQKLKHAHELAAKYGKDKNETSTITTVVYAHTDSFYQWNTYSNEEFKTQNIDELITKLQELTEPQPMYKNAWYLIDNEIRCTVVHDKEGYQFCDESTWIYPTKQALIEAQIEYWTCLKNEEKSTPCACNHPELASAGQVFKKCDFCGKSAWFDECRHESDGMIYYSYPPNKCKKCGEFYK